MSYNFYVLHHQSSVSPPYPVSLLFHAFQNTDFLISLSCYFFTIIKKDSDIFRVKYTQCHTYTYMNINVNFLRFGVHAKSNDNYFHVQFCSNVAIEIWVFPACTIANRKIIIITIDCGWTYFSFVPEGIRP